MVNPGLSRLDGAVAAKPPEYNACLSRAQMKGMGALITGSGALFLLQKLINRKLPYSLQLNLMLSVGTSAVICDVVTRRETRKCSDLLSFLETAQSLQEAAHGSLHSPDHTENAETKQNKYGDVMK